MQKSRACQNGFTLVELLVVLSIVAILSAMAGPRVFTAVRGSQQGRADKDLQTIAEAVERHYLDLGYYPNKLKDLVTRGYLREGTTFRSPVNKHWYFYAVDDNRPSSRAKAYVLGHPGASSDIEHSLHRGGELPRGRNPAHRAWAWYFYENQGTVDGLKLYASNDVDYLPDPEIPTSLAAYRYSCQSGAAEPCDLRAN